MTEAHPCLLNVKKKTSKYLHFPFLQDQIKIGRSIDATYTILSNTVSRCHVIIDKKGDNSWTIMDNKSLNGTAVNGQKLTPMEPYILQDGDMVQLGVPPSPQVEPEFVYRFWASLKVRKQPRGKKRAAAQGEAPAKRLKGEDTEQSCEEARTQEEDNREDKPEGMKDEGEDIQVQAGGEGKSEVEERLRALAEQLQAKEQENAAMAQQLQREREERQVMEQRQRQQEERVCQLDARQQQLMQERAAAEDQMRQQLEAELRTREEVVRNQMQQQLGELVQERRTVEEQLQQEKEKAVQQKDRELQERLQGERDRLQKVIETKELEQKTLENQLAESRSENEKVKADTFSTREAILSEFAETMETELQCSICNELFVKATSLNCAHAFCALCIKQWLSVKRECPNCRTAVTSQLPSLVLDNYIDRMVDQLSPELKQRRAQLVQERKETERKLEEEERKRREGPSTAAGRGRGQGRQRGRSRGRGRGGRGNANTAAATSTATATVTTTAAAPGGAGAPGQSGGNILLAMLNRPDAIVVSDEGSGSEEEDETDPEMSSPDLSMLSEEERIMYGDPYRDSDDDTDSEPGDPDVYYGGYGRCFRCGSRGHWANGCPN